MRQASARSKVEAEAAGRHDEEKAEGATMIATTAVTIVGVVVTKARIKVVAEATLDAAVAAEAIAGELWMKRAITDRMLVRLALLITSGRLLLRMLSVAISPQHCNQLVICAVTIARVNGQMMQCELSHLL